MRFAIVNEIIDHRSNASEVLKKGEICISGMATFSRHSLPTQLKTVHFRLKYISGIENAT
jgi:hypothetical protein